MCVAGDEDTGSAWVEESSRRTVRHWRLFRWRGVNKGPQVGARRAEDSGKNKKWCGFSKFSTRTS